MKKPAIFLILIHIYCLLPGQIIADHTVVDEFDDIPQVYMDEVKKMLLVIGGESHSRAYGEGFELLEAINSSYNVEKSSYPDAPYSENYLRYCRATWGDFYNETGWIGHYGEEDWFTNPTAVERTKAGISYCNANGYPMSAFGFAWCYDAEAGLTSEGEDSEFGVHWHGNSLEGPEGDLPWGLNADDYSLTGNSVNMDSYLAATQAYIDYCEANNIPTKVFFTTGPVDSYESSEISYQGYLKWEYIRAYVKADPSRILFDYADILCYDDDGTAGTTTWNDHTYPHITANNLGEGSYAHIGQPGELRLAKAMWWMLARIAGWDGGNLTNVPIHEGTEPTLVQLADKLIVTSETGISEYNNCSIHTIQGSLVHQEVIADYPVDVEISALSSGVYIISLSNFQDIISWRFVIL